MVIDDPSAMSKQQKTVFVCQECGSQSSKWLGQCRDCGAWIWCPRPACGECGSDNFVWTELSGRGEIFAFTVIREVVGRALRGFEKDIPYVTAWIDLEEGPRICSNVVCCPIETVRIGMPVEVLFEEAREGIFLPKFKPR